VTKRFNLPPYVVPGAVSASVKAPYMALRDLVVIDHPNRAVIDKVLMDLVRGGAALVPGAVIKAPRAAAVAELARRRWGQPQGFGWR
jgi:hypothetical protein